MASRFCPGVDSGNVAVIVPVSGWLQWVRSVFGSLRGVSSFRLMLLSAYRVPMMWRPADAMPKKWNVRACRTGTSTAGV